MFIATYHTLVGRGWQEIRNKEVIRFERSGNEKIFNLRRGKSDYSTDDPE